MARLVCRRCGRFYGYVKDDKDRRFYAKIEQDHGYIDISKVTWSVTDYTNKSDNVKRKKEPVYKPATDDTQCECGKHFFGTVCPECGATREVRKVRVTKKRRRR